jgi:hypothetical protein
MAIVKVFYVYHSNNIWLINDFYSAVRSAHRPPHKKIISLIKAYATIGGRMKRNARFLTKKISHL